MPTPLSPSRLSHQLNSTRPAAATAGWHSDDTAVPYCRVPLPARLATRLTILDPGRPRSINSIDNRAAIVPTPILFNKSCIRPRRHQFQAHTTTPAINQRCTETRSDFSPLSLSGAFLFVQKPRRCITAYFRATASYTADQGYCVTCNVDWRLRATPAPLTEASIWPSCCACLTGPILPQ